MSSVKIKGILQCENLKEKYKVEQVELDSDQIMLLNLIVLHSFMYEIL